MKPAYGIPATTVRRPAKFGRTSLYDALVQALRQTRTTRAAASRLIGVTPLTIRRWLKQESAITVELIANTPKIAAIFARCFAIAMRKQERAERGNGNPRPRTAPRIARKRAKGRR